MLSISGRDCKMRLQKKAGCSSGYFTGLPDLCQVQVFAATQWPNRRCRRTRWLFWKPLEHNLGWQDLNKTSTFSKCFIRFVLGESRPLVSNTLAQLCFQIACEVDHFQDGSLFWTPSSSQNRQIASLVENFLDPLGVGYCCLLDTKRQRRTSYINKNHHHGLLTSLPTWSYLISNLKE